MIVLGLDPGLVHTGWGILKEDSGILTVQDYGQISPKKNCPNANRLSVIYTEVRKKITDCAPDIVAIEKTLIGKGADKSLALAHAYGCCLAAIGSTSATYRELMPTQIKKTLTGQGSASKDQVVHMIKTLWPCTAEITHHAADGLAAAFSAIQLRKMLFCDIK